MNRPRILTAAAAIISALVPLIALAHGGPQSQGKHTDTKPAASSKPAPSTEKDSRGEQVFQQNCSRCHNAPQGFPPQVSGTIVRHMRMRASLSAADEKALLEFMNP
ncbi:MAG TPA: hypothetical protein VGJ21_03130 [Terracidiphilus sp.]